MQKVGAFSGDGCGKTGEVWPVPMGADSNQVVGL
jgi:hypothetical protein